MTNFFIFLFALTFFCSCNVSEKKEPVAKLNEKYKMIEADRAFSKLSVEKGMRKAFIQYIDSNGVLLRPNQYPLIGAEAIDFLTQVNDTGFTMQWEPKGGSIAQSGELGYTFGLYALTPSKKDTTFYGTYVSIWKKQPDGSWKFILDSGNEGLTETRNTLDSL
jgi:ketosteroid isomerase-like protein